MNYYDYSVGLETPYWIQEFSARGKVYFRFQTPKSVPFFAIFIGTFLILMLFFLQPIAFLAKYTLGIPWLLFFYLPLKAGKSYVEELPDGKKLHFYVWGLLRYFKDFTLDQRLIFQEERRSPVIEKMVFEKTRL
ncbi:TcpE family conjugal transfer membrane protein [Lactococcus lactis]|uniref:Transfer protein n=1 Tax=Lactococcus lactis subsp. lactis A12 TaxID=1137134 RepID=S6EWJ2_LACLL|nr:TcpE family conjugal transfer membrane protein [Lactococcus lactis]CDG03738.1 Putative transfer protein [Lactococcus lactis subsp. lactis A12]SBW29609.1 Putative transfer protein [Lactococcus lactis subsp. lactis]